MVGWCVASLVPWFDGCFVISLSQHFACWLVGLKVVGSLVRCLVGVLARRLTGSLVRFALVSWFVDAFLRWPVGMVLFLLIRLLAHGCVVAPFGGVMVRRSDDWLVGWWGRLVGWLVGWLVGYVVCCLVGVVSCGQISLMGWLLVSMLVGWGVVAVLRRSCSKEIDCPNTESTL